MGRDKNDKKSYLPLYLEFYVLELKGEEA